TAEGLPPGEEFQLVWRTVDGAWKVTDAEYRGREYRAVDYEIAKLKTDQTGRLNAQFVAPEDFGFMHDIVLQQGGRLFTQTGFSIPMTVEISPKSGPVGTPISVEAKAIGWRPLVFRKRKPVAKEWARSRQGRKKGSHRSSRASSCRLCLPSTGQSGQALGQCWKACSTATTITVVG